jgi:hypothetical protein
MSINVSTRIKSNLSLERAVSWLRAQGQPYKKVKLSDYPLRKYTINSVSLISPLVVVPARLRALDMALYFISQGYDPAGMEWLLIDEIPDPLIVPWKAIGDIMRAVGKVVMAIALLSLLGAALSFLWDILVLLAQVAFYGVMGIVVLTVGCQVDPILVLSVTDEKGEKKCYLCAWWLHTSEK